jgi:hypothetical protein
VHFGLLDAVLRENVERASKEPAGDVLVVASDDDDDVRRVAVARRRQARVRICWKQS